MGLFLLICILLDLISGDSEIIIDPMAASGFCKNLCQASLNCFLLISFELMSAGMLMNSFSLGLTMEVSSKR